MVDSTEAPQFCSKEKRSSFAMHPSHNRWLLLELEARNAYAKWGFMSGARSLGWRQELRRWDDHGRGRWGVQRRCDVYEKRRFRASEETRDKEVVVQRIRKKMKGWRWKGRWWSRARGFDVSEAILLRMLCLLGIWLWWKRFYFFLFFFLVWG